MNHDNHDSKSFWKEVKRMNQQDEVTPLAESTEGHSGQEGVTELWRNHFSSLLNFKFFCPSIPTPRTTTR